MQQIFGGLVWGTVSARVFLDALVVCDTVCNSSCGSCATARRSSLSCTSLLNQRTILFATVKCFSFYLQGSIDVFERSDPSNPAMALLHGRYSTSRYLERRIIPLINVIDVRETPTDTFIAVIQQTEGQTGTASWSGAQSDYISTHLAHAKH